MCLSKIGTTAMKTGDNHVKLQENRNGTNNRQSLLHTVCNPGDDLNHICMNSNNRKNITLNTKTANKSRLNLSNRSINDNSNNESFGFQLPSNNSNQSANCGNDLSLLKLSSNKNGLKSPNYFENIQDRSTSFSPNSVVTESHKSKMNSSTIGMNIGLIDPSIKETARKVDNKSLFFQSNGNMTDGKIKSVDFGMSEYFHNGIEKNNNNTISMNNIDVNNDSFNKKRKLEMNNFEDMSLDFELDSETPKKKRQRVSIGKNETMNSINYDNLIKMSQSIGSSTSSVRTQTPSVVVLNYAPTQVFFLLVHVGFLSVFKNVSCVDIFVFNHSFIPFVCLILFSFFWFGPTLNVNMELNHTHDQSNKRQQEQVTSLGFAKFDQQYLSQLRTSTTNTNSNNKDTTGVIGARRNHSNKDNHNSNNDGLKDSYIGMSNVSGFIGGTGSNSNNKDNHNSNNDGLKDSYVGMSNVSDFVGAGAGTGSKNNHNSNNDGLKDAYIGMSNVSGVVGASTNNSNNPNSSQSHSNNSQSNNSHSHNNHSRSGNNGNLNNAPNTNTNRTSTNVLIISKNGVCRYLDSYEIPPFIVNVDASDVNVAYSGNWYLIQPNGICKNVDTSSNDYKQREEYLRKQTKNYETLRSVYGDNVKPWFIALNGDCRFYLFDKFPNPDSKKCICRYTGQPCDEKNHYHRGYQTNLLQLDLLKMKHARSLAKQDCQRETLSIPRNFANIFVWFMIFLIRELSIFFELRLQFDFVASFLFCYYFSYFCFDF